MRRAELRREQARDQIGRGCCGLTEDHVHRTAGDALREGVRRKQQGRTQRQGVLHELTTRPGRTACGAEGRIPEIDQVVH